MITIEDIKLLIKEETEKLNVIGLFPVQINEVVIVKAKSFYADAWRELNKIRVSFYYLDAPVDEIRATIMHELCHMVPESGHGHGVKWKEIADKVNLAYPQYNIKRVGSNLRGTSTSYNLRSQALLQSSSNKPKKSKNVNNSPTVQCDCCGRLFIRTRESRLTLHPEYYRCVCGGSLRRIS